MIRSRTHTNTGATCPAPVQRAAAGSLPAFAAARAHDSRRATSNRVSLRQLSECLTVGPDTLRKGQCRGAAGGRCDAPRIVTGEFGRATLGPSGLRAGGETPGSTHADVAQLVERLPSKQGVAGSNPVVRSKTPKGRG